MLDGRMRSASPSTRDDDLVPARAEARALATRPRLLDDRRDADRDRDLRDRAQHRRPRRPGRDRRCGPSTRIAATGSSSSRATPGPGIRDVDAALAGRLRGRGAASGSGLPGARRLMDEFEIDIGSRTRDDRDDDEVARARRARAAARAACGAGVTTVQFQQRYSAGFFATFLAERDERSLRAAYELGRDAVRYDISLLEIAQAHHDALERRLASAPAEEAVATCRAAGEFLVGGGPAASKWCSAARRRHVAQRSSSAGTHACSGNCRRC